MAKICKSCQHAERYSFKSTKCGMEYNENEICNGELIDIDDLMIPIITELWNKGYKTEACCSGHPYDSYMNIYILFGEEYPVINNTSWLSRFDCSTVNNKTALQLNFNFNVNDTVFYKMNELTKVHKTLYKYIKSLPSTK